MASSGWIENSDTFNALMQVSTATLTTQLFKRGLRTRFLAGVAPIRGGTRMVGSARTLRYIPMREDIDTLETLGARNNAQRVLVESIGPGEVLVVDGLGMTTAGSLGAILAMRLQVRGCAGIVTDGSFRDTPSIRDLQIPAYSAGMNANTNLTKYHPADFDVKIGCGGVFVEPGDAIVGDDEGVVVIPAHLVNEVAADSLEQEEREDYIFERVRAGESVFDVYPMNGQVAAEYEAWKHSHSETPSLK